MRKQHHRSEKIVLGMSGGVDSSVSLMLLKQAGYEVIGVSLKYDTWGCSRRENACCSKESFDSAKRICKKFNSPHVILDVTREFKAEVIEYFKSELKANRTPNPCVFCNPKVKFKSLLEYADKIGADFVATGHYAKKIKKGNEYHLLRAKDLEKDQTYSLSFLTQKMLSRIIFPLGDLSKTEVYNLAGESAALKFYKKIKQSQDFCFLGKNELNDFIEKEIQPVPGEIVDADGTVLGRHRGLQYYTLGQRKGVRLPGGPYYVIYKNMGSNQLVVAKNVSEFTENSITLCPYNLINEINFPAEVQVKLRSAQAVLRARLTKNKNSLVLDFDKPQLAVTPGQIAVIYNKNQCLGGGVINL